MTVSEALNWATQKLLEARVPEPQTDAEWLLAHVLGRGRTNLKFNRKEVLTDEQRRTYERLVSKRAQRVPLAYIIGEQPFCGLVLKVDERVMIPRQETEQLVELVSERLKKIGNEHLMVADIGTGSGAIGLALASRFERATVLGVDISDEALEVAEQNARRLGLTKRCVFLKGDLTEPLEAIFSVPVFDAVVANLPYVADSEWEKLEPEVRHYEPEIALRGGTDGLSVISRFVLRPIQLLLASHGFVALEVGAGQAPKVQNLLKKRGWKRVAILKDFAGIERFLFAQR
ncbi:MAG: peptide chain release factor N(5)-glutamine methyltransferase [Armatimonadetes bacterium]|nr:peptide chain release factor N(5)-glutamine methyltransferase [Armatimonadota bacterium]